jgi:hypothetical protein
MLLEDPIQDVRQAAQTALGFLEGPASTRPALRPERRNGRRIWSSAAPADSDTPQNEPWRAALRARFALPDGEGDSEAG